MGGIADSNRGKQFLEEKDSNEIGEFAKKSQPLVGFPDYSIIEGNSIENKKEKTSSLMGTIEKQGGESYFFCGDSMVDMDQAFLPDKLESTHPQPIKVIKVQDREIQIPQLNLKRAIALENRETYKFKQDSQYYPSSNSGSPS